jgi:hypothetical protein
MSGLRVRLDLVAFVLIFAHLISADTYALPPMTKLLDKCIDGPLGMQVCVRVNKTGCLSMNVDISLNGESLKSGERSIAQLVQDIQLNSTARLPLTYCQAVSLPLGDCNACLEVKEYRMSSQSRTIALSGVGSVSCPGDIRQTFQIDGLQLEDCFWVCPNDCPNGACSIDGKCQCSQGYYGPDCSIREENNLYNGTIFPDGNLHIAYANNDCRVLNVHATSTSGTVYNHYYNIANITHPVNRNKHYPLFHSNNAAISPGCRATIYAYRYVVDAQFDKINPPLNNCRAIDYACQGQKDLLPMGTYPVDQCETIAILNSTKCNTNTPSAPQPVSPPLSQPVGSPRPAPRPNIVPTSQQEPSAATDGESNVGKNVVIALAVLVGAAILIVASYVLYKRWKQRQQIEMIGEYVTEDVFDSDDDEELVTLEPQPGLRV